MTSDLAATEESRRLADTAASWKKWGPYLSDRQWGTVREDYSPNGDAWSFFPHDHARSRAYRWGEDAIGGFSDDQQFWCLGLALWNGQDPILKERLFGLTNNEGNHGEDVKELYFHQDATPSHAYLKMLYKYPQAAFPYTQLLDENRRRDRTQPEYEILDTGIFDDNLYFDITIEYAQAAPGDVLVRVTATNRAAIPAPLHLLPQLWARNIWSWSPGAPRPALRLYAHNTIQALHPNLPDLHLALDQPAPWLFCENETNTNRLWHTQAPGPFKDGINDAILHNAPNATRDDTGTKAAAHIQLTLAPRASHTIRLRLRPATSPLPAFEDFDATFTTRIAEADAFYAALQSHIPHPDARFVQRQALAGLIWSKQFYLYDVQTWLDGDPAYPPPPASRRAGRNADWRHVSASDIIAMPDKWEYPWFASWDLGFHAVTYTLIDPAFAKSQILLLLGERYMHPSGQIPAYEWSFSDNNPPLESWAAWRTYQLDKARTGTPDQAFLRTAFHKLLLNFGWWVNRKDAQGRNLFQGGFLGLDNIGVFNRSAPLPTGGRLDQADGTAWMATFALAMMRIALELATTDHVYEDMATKFFEHFLYITEAMSRAGNGIGLWDDQDSFFYDVLRLPDGDAVPLRLRSIVGLIPMFAVQVLEPECLALVPNFAARLEWFLKHRPDLAALISNWRTPGQQHRHLLSLLRGHRLKSLLARMLDPREFWSDQGVRALSKIHESEPFSFPFNGKNFEIRYAPAESPSGEFGGNSNWRGPVWMPINLRLFRALLDFHEYYGDDFIVEFPVDSGEYVSLRDIAEILKQRLISLSTLSADNTRKVMAAYPQLAHDPSLLLFHEYYDGESGRGAGASHQTGWSAGVALLF